VAKKGGDRVEEYLPKEKRGEKGPYFWGGKNRGWERLLQEKSKGARRGQKTIDFLEDEKRALITGGAGRGEKGKNGKTKEFGERKFWLPRGGDGCST